MQVFVSYSLPDRDCALQLVERVESAGIGCWIAPRNIRPAADWAEEIIDAIGCARVMVLILSENSNHSPQVRREVERAVHKGVALLPFRLADVLPSKSLEYFLSAQHWLDAFPPPLEDHYRRLVAHLTTILDGHSPELRPAPTVAPGAVSAAHLRHIELQLAGYIGPIAKHLVKRAAAHAACLEALLDVLSGELENERERREFVVRCRASLPS
jgi:hypothetical protein